MGDNMKHLGTKELETERLILRRFTIKDAYDVYNNWASDKEVVKYLTWTAHDSVDVSKEILNTWISNYEKDDFYQWSIVPKDLDQSIGSISIVQQNKLAELVHVGYCIGKRWWGEGITTEAFKRLIKFFFEEVKVNRIESRFDPRNPGSGKVMEKCGLKYEGRSRQSDWNNQGICDASFYSILASDYFKEK